MRYQANIRSPARPKLVGFFLFRFVPACRASYTKERCEETRRRLLGLETDKE